MGLTREELNEEFDKLSNGSGLSEEFTDGELWPTAGLSDRQIELLTEKLIKVRESDKKNRFLGKLGLRP
jgi:hypothetical protein